jgi:hypothetical protein
VAKKSFSILQHTPYLGSTNDKVIHSTENPCQDALLIPIDARWYIRSIPHSSGYEKCPKCFKRTVEEDS